MGPASPARRCVERECLALSTAVPLETAEQLTARLTLQVCSLAEHLEQRAAPQQVGDCLVRWLVMMFAADLGQLPPQLLMTCLAAWQAQAERTGQPVVPDLQPLWQHLPGCPQQLADNTPPLALTGAELQTLATLATASWQSTPPTILGTVLERALAPAERHRLGVHYTPADPLQRLVDRTVISPLRAEWSHASSHGRAAELLQRLRKVRVLDPACGTGNFLYVAMQALARLEAEVRATLLASDQTKDGAREIQFYGIERKHSAAAVAELVLWIGAIQAQRVVGELLVARIDHRDALIDYDATEIVADPHGNPIMQAVGVTSKRMPRRMIAVDRPVAATQAPWPEAEFIVGNPPFLGNKRMRDILGPGYVAAIRTAYPEVPGNADLVMWWWWRAADLVAQGKVRSFGFVTTNSITQASNRKVVHEALTRKGLHLRYAIADLPWVSAAAAVRISLTVVIKAPGDAVLGTARNTQDAQYTQSPEIVDQPVGKIYADLSTSTDVSLAKPLRANQNLCFQGVNLVGEGFRLARAKLIEYGYDPANLPPVLRPYQIGRDLVRQRQDRYVIDFYGIEPDTARREHPQLWQHLSQWVRPERLHNNRRLYRDQWWLFGEPRPGLRRALAGLPRYIATSETAKHLIFQFIGTTVCPDHSIYAIASADPAVLAVLNSSVHRAWAYHPGIGARQGQGNDLRWRNLTCFAPFPNPQPDPKQRQALCDLGTRLQAHRDAYVQADPALTLTGLYNSMPTDLRALHDELDAAVLAAYGWPTDLSPPDIVARLVALNRDRNSDRNVA